MVGIGHKVSKESEKRISKSMGISRCRDNCLNKHVNFRTTDKFSSFFNQIIHVGPCIMIAAVLICTCSPVTYVCRSEDS